MENDPREDSPHTDITGILPEFTGEDPDDSPRYNPFTDPESPFYGIEDFRPTSRAPIPALRCGRIKKDGERCKNFGRRGTGLTAGALGIEKGHGMAMCHVHGGQLPRVKAHADKIVDAARLQLMSSAPDAIQTIYNLMVGTRTPDAVKLAAAKDVLDRANVRGTIEVAVEVTNNELPSAKILKRLEEMRRKDEPTEAPLEETPLEDLGETNGQAE